MRSPYNDPEVKRKFYEKVSIGGLDSCWEWQGYRWKGYGQLSYTGAPNGRYLIAHRVAWELLRGPIPEGLTIDHLCRNRACCNPRHMEPCDAVTNSMRGNAVCAINKRKTHCHRGHPFDEENTYLVPGGRACRECQRINDRKYREKLKMQALEKHYSEVSVT